LTLQAVPVPLLPSLEFAGTIIIIIMEPSSPCLHFCLDAGFFFALW
jgi:hypothetical protein